MVPAAEPLNDAAYLAAFQVSLRLCPVSWGCTLAVSRVRPTVAFSHGVRLSLTLQDERRFANGMIFLNYRSAQRQAA